MMHRSLVAFVSEASCLHFAEKYTNVMRRFGIVRHDEDDHFIGTFVHPLPWAWASIQQFLAEEGVAPLSESYQEGVTFMEEHAKGGMEHLWQLIQNGTAYKWLNTHSSPMDDIRVLSAYSLLSEWNTPVGDLEPEDIAEIKSVLASSPLPASAFIME